MFDLAFISYTAVMSITPGPNNLMLAASGVNHGFRRTLPHILGITFGICVQLLLIAVMLGTALNWFAPVRRYLALAGCLYLLWLSWRIIRAGSPGQGETSRPLGFWGAALFQALNPKAWIMSVNAVLVFLPDGPAMHVSVAWLLLAYAAVNLPCIAVWAFTGDRLRRLLTRPVALRVFNAVMGGLMAATAVYLLAEEFIVR